MPDRQLTLDEARTDGLVSRPAAMHLQSQPVGELSRACNAPTAGLNRRPNPGESVPSNARTASW